MKSEEKQLSYQIKNTYSTLGKFTSKTKNVWVVFHGIGYLSRYFLKHFRALDLEENYIIAPQAQSKYYLNNTYKHIGASWLTKENTAMEIENAIEYLDQIYKIEQLEKSPKLILFGYSQGVSMATRWLARRKIDCSQLILHSGKIPAEFTSADFEFLEKTEVKFIYGTEDPFLDDETIKTGEKYAMELFGENLEFIPFKGGHEVNEKLIIDFF